MRVEHYYAGCYWGERVEPMEVCARRAALLFEGLRRLDPSFARWFELGWSRKQALQHEIDPSEDGFLKLLSRKKYQFTSSTFHFATWNGLPDGESSALDFFCGATDSLVIGSCVVDLPFEGVIAERVRTVGFVTELLRLMAVAWEPVWGLAAGYELRDLFWNENVDVNSIGWVTYFSRDRGVIPPLPEPCRVEPVGEQGSLVVLT
ncbi:MAG TPA: Imm52 family immunity protein, partial [Myxococcaceae bacterium]|nr:Imm52 family immunity protein [Myxococcaceae bacterium]